MATITKRNDSYRIRVSNKYDSSGKQNNLSMTWRPRPGMTTKQIEKELERQAVLFEEKVKLGQYFDGSIKFSNFVERWMQDYAEKQLKQKTIDRYKSLLTRINSSLGNIKMTNITPNHIIKFFNSLDEAKREDEKYKSTKDIKTILSSKNVTKAKLTELTGLSQSTISVAMSGKNVSKLTASKISKALSANDIFIPIEDQHLSGRTKLHYYRLLSSIFQRAVYWQVVPYNVCDRVEAPKVHEKEAKYLDENEVCRLIEFLENEPYENRVIICFCIFTGFRRSEVLGLEWRDIDFENLSISVKRTLHYSKNRGGLYEDTPKNPTSERTIIVTLTIIKMLKEFKTWKAEQRQISENQIIKTEKVFSKLDGQPMNPDRLSNLVSKLIKKTDLTQISLHSLRHTNATLLIMRGEPVRLVADWLGHAKPSTTENIYSHSIKSRDSRAAEVLDNILSPFIEGISNNKK